MQKTLFSGSASGIEGELAELEANLADVRKSLRAVTSAVNQADKAVHGGTLYNLDRVLAELDQRAGDLKDRVGSVASAWRRGHKDDWIDGSSLLVEVAEAAQSSGLKGVVVRDGMLLSYPVTVKVDASDLSARIGKAKVRTLRPSRVAEMLRSLRERQGRSGASFLEALERTYLLATKGETGHAVPLKRIHELLTLRPGQAKDYGIYDLVMDLYSLDAARELKTKAGRTLTFPASTSTRGGAGITFATEKGDEKTYSTIAFHEARR